MSKKDLSKHLHVVRSCGIYGTWGRGLDEDQARKNAGLKKSDPYQLFIFKNDNWDIYDTGTITWEDGNEPEIIERNT